MEKTRFLPSLSLKSRHYSMRERVGSAMIEAQQRGQQRDDFIAFNQKVQDLGGYQPSSHVKGRLARETAVGMSKHGNQGLYDPGEYAMGLLTSLHSDGDCWRGRDRHRGLASVDVFP